MIGPTLFSGEPVIYAIIVKGELTTNGAINLGIHITITSKGGIGDHDFIFKNRENGCYCLRRLDLFFAGIDFLHLNGGMKRLHNKSYACGILLV